MDPSRFLASLAQALSTMALYKDGAPARERVIDRSFTLLQESVGRGQHPSSPSWGDEVIYGKTSLRDLRDWEWSKRFGTLGIQRLEFEPNVSREDFADFLELISSRAGGRRVPGSTPRKRDR